MYYIFIHFTVFFFVCLFVCFVFCCEMGIFFSFYWRIIALQNFVVFCQTSTWISHRYTYIPEKATAPHSSTLAWKIPWTEEPGRLQCMGSRRVRHDWATSLSCIGEGNGNPLQCSCLENPRDGGAWWAAIYGVAQSRTWLKWLSSSSSSRYIYPLPLEPPSHLPPHPTPLGWYRAPVWVSWAMQQILIGCLF